MPEVRGELITYCTNIHPGESWGEVFAALRRYVPAVKVACSPDRTFPIGLRLAERAARELDAARNREFTDWLRANDCFVPTLNGFPYGAFHGGRVKENVYLPDWRSPERAAYSMRLADLLAGWLPEGMAGSISSVPLGFKGVVGWEDLPALKVCCATWPKYTSDREARSSWPWSRSRAACWKPRTRPAASLPNWPCRKN